MAGIKSIVLRRLRLPLIRPYRLAYRTFEEFEPYMVEVEDEEGRKGFADAHISPGSSSEMRDGGWQFCLARIDQILGMAAEDAKALILSRFEESKVATTALVAALEVLQDNAQLEIPEDVESDRKSTRLNSSH